MANSLLNLHVDLPAVGLVERFHIVMMRVAVGKAFFFSPLADEFICTGGGKHAKASPKGDTTPRERLHAGRTQQKGMG